MSALVHMVSSAARFCLSALGLWSALVVLTGCATSHSVTALADGITVHTFRRDYTNAHVVSRGEAYFMVDSGALSGEPLGRSGRVIGRGQRGRMCRSDGADEGALEWVNSVSPAKGEANARCGAVERSRRGSQRVRAKTRR